MYLLVPRQDLQGICPFIVLIAHLWWAACCPPPTPHAQNPFYQNLQKGYFLGNCVGSWTTTSRPQEVPLCFSEDCTPECFQSVGSYTLTMPAPWRVLGSYKEIQVWSLKWEKDNLRSKQKVSLYNMEYIPHLKTTFAMLRVRHLRKMCGF